MGRRVQIYRSNTPGNVPTGGSILPGELAVNLQDQKLWVGDAAGTGIVEIPGGGGGGTTTPPTVFYDAQASNFPKTYTKPAGLVYAIIELVGGGGGGGGPGATGVGQAATASGGGGGGYMQVVLLANALGATEEYVTGDNAIAGFNGNPGTDGRTAYFTITATNRMEVSGGKGGAISAAASTYGWTVASLGGEPVAPLPVVGGDILSVFASSGGSGASGYRTDNGTFARGGDGGTCVVTGITARGAHGIAAEVGVGEPGANPGEGGGGGCAAENSSFGVGGNAKGGSLTVWEYY